MKADTNDKIHETILKFHHEIRTPLNLILGLSQLLYIDKYINQNDKEEYLKLISDESEKLINNIDIIVKSIIEKVEV